MSRKCIQYIANGELRDKETEKGGRIRDRLHRQYHAVERDQDNKQGVVRVTKFPS